MRLRRTRRIWVASMAAPKSEGVDPTGGIPFELRRAMSTFPITLYTALDCGPCESARAWLRRRGAPYQEIVVETETTPKS